MPGYDYLKNVKLKRPRKPASPGNKKIFVIVIAVILVLFGIFLAVIISGNKKAVAPAQNPAQTQNISLPLTNSQKAALQETLQAAKASSTLTSTQKTQLKKTLQNATTTITAGQKADLLKVLGQ